MKYQIVVIGAGPGGYVAALRAAQLGLRVALVERENLGGVCLNWGCIPTKALLQCAHTYRAVSQAHEFGVEVHNLAPDLERMVQRSRQVAASMSKGVEFLLRKANVEVVMGEASFADARTLSVAKRDGTCVTMRANHIVIATGARPREVGPLRIDGERVLGYRQALTLTAQPKRMVIVGSGAIGAELALFYHTIGTEVTLLEAQANLLPLEDDDTSKAIARSLRKRKLRAMTSAQVIEIARQQQGVLVHVETPKGIERIETDVVVAAVGIVPNLEGLNLEQVGVVVERGRIAVDEHYCTSVEGVYAIGDVIATPALAHVASAEAVHCVERIAGMAPHPVDYGVVPACTYTTPEVGSVGARERDLVAQGAEYVVGRFEFMASGKATAMGERDGMVKLLFARDGHRLLGAHIVGAAATEMIAELALALRMGATAETLHSTIHPHPTLSEAVMEAAAQALGCCVHG